MEKNPAGYFKLKNWKNLMQIDMGYGLSSFQGRGTKLDRFLAKNYNHCILSTDVAQSCQKNPKSDFQSQFSMSKINGFF